MKIQRVLIITFFFLISEGFTFQALAQQRSRSAAAEVAARFRGFERGASYVLPIEVRLETELDEGEIEPELIKVILYRYESPEFAGSPLQRGFTKGVRLDFGSLESRRFYSGRSADGDGAEQIGDFGLVKIEFGAAYRQNSELVFRGKAFFGFGQSALRQSQLKLSEAYLASVRDKVGCPDCLARPGLDDPENFFSSDMGLQMSVHYGELEIEVARTRKSSQSVYQLWDYDDGGDVVLTGGQRAYWMDGFRTIAQTETEVEMAYPLVEKGRFELEVFAGLEYVDYEDVTDQHDHRPGAQKWRRHFINWENKVMKGKLGFKVGLKR